MRVVHLSDFHGCFLERDDAPPPKGDVYVCTGDMFPNDPLIVFRNFATMEERTVTWDEGSRFPRSQWQPVRRHIDRAHEVSYQQAWLERWLKTGNSFRRDVLGIDTFMPVVCVRGNHDFIDLSPLFGGQVYEIHEPDDDVIELRGLRFGGMRGINRIADEWSDEMHVADLNDRCRRLPLDLDVLVTHAPPENLLDDAGGHWGVTGLRNYLDRACGLRAHLFGHIHEQGGKVEDHMWWTPFDTGKSWSVKLSNAATKFNVVDL